jgi:hypothetical protein
MSDDFCKLIDLIVAHDKLRLNFQEICRHGSIRAKGVKTKFKENAPGHWVTEASPEIEWIPPDDFGELRLIKIRDDLVLSGARYWSGAESIPQLKEWTSVIFPNSDLTELKQRVEANLTLTQAPLHTAEKPTQTGKRPKPAPRKRGPKTATRDRLADQMFEELKTDKIKADRLESMGGQRLADSYGAHRDTCNSAREMALAKFRAPELPPVTAN